MSRGFLSALASSLLLHALPFAADLKPQPKPARRPPLLEASLKLLPPPPPPPAPELTLPDPPPKPEPATPPPKAQKRLTTPKPGPVKAPAWQEEVKRQFSKLNDKNEYYPQEAILAGQEGDAIVLIILDEAGNVVAARLEQGSGHRLLDEAALRNVRRLRALPEQTPREAVLTVRFRLR